MRVVLYKRRSTSEELQPDSHSIQDDQLRQYAAVEKHEVVRGYVDDASGRSADRKGFQALIRDVTNGPDFEAILVLDVTRWGRFANVDESAYWEFFCLLHGVRVLYVNEPFRQEGPYEAILKTLKRVQAAEFSKDKSRTVQYGKARITRNGFYAGGSAPYAYQRIVVRPTGDVVQALARGEHKAVGNYRIKLAPGDPREVATVQRLFALFLGGMPRKAIARTLIADQHPAPGTTWHYSEVHKILRNPVYAGYAVLRCKPSPNFPNGETILTPAAWPAIISEHDWRKAQAALDSSLWQRTPPGLAEQLRRAFERYGPLRKRTPEVPAWETYLRHFRNGTQEALSLAYHDKIAHEQARVERALAKQFRVTHEGGLTILNNLLRVRFVASFPRLLRRGVYWEYRFHEDDAQDVTIGLGFSPPPCVDCLQHFLFHNRRFRPRERRIHPNLDGKTTENHFRRTLPQLVSGLEACMYRDAAKAPRLLLAAMERHDVVSSPALARELGWPTHAVYTMYQRLQRDHFLPPLKQKRKGYVDVTCSACGGVRRMRLWDALKLKTELCQACWRRHHGHPRLAVTCPNCGKVRQYWQADLPKLRDGIATRCAACTDNWGASATVRHERNNARRAALTRLMTMISDELRERHPDVRLVTKSSSLAPRIGWHQPGQRRERILRLTIPQRESLRLTRLDDLALRLLARHLANYRRWRPSRNTSQDVWDIRFGKFAPDTRTRESVP